MMAYSQLCDKSDLIRALQDVFGKNETSQFYLNALSSNKCHGNETFRNSLTETEHDQNFKDILELLQDEDSVHGNFGRDVCAYVTPLIIIIGIAGNIASLCVFLSRRLRALSASHYLAALSASDTVVLTTYVFLDWLSKGLPRWPGGHRAPIIDINGICQAFLFVSYTFRFVSVYLILVFTIERYIAVCKPLHRRIICTRNFAKRLILMVLIMGAVISIPKPLLSGVYRPHEFMSTTAIEVDKTNVLVNESLFLDFFKPQRNESHSTVKSATAFNPPSHYEPIEQKAVCMRNPEFDSINIVLEIVYGILITAIPFILLVFFNMLIMRRLIRRFSVTNKLDVSFRENRIRWEFTVMLLVVSSCFILLNIPYFIVWIQQYQYSVKTTNIAKVHQLSSALYLTKTIFYLNYCINFFLYCLTGSYYRTVIREWFVCCRSKHTALFANGYHHHTSPSMRKFSQSMSLSTQSTFV